MIFTELTNWDQHPVTGEKALFVNEAFTRRIVGFKDEESQMLLKFLYDHIAKVRVIFFIDGESTLICFIQGADFQARATYKPGTVVIWVNHLIFVPWIRPLIVNL